ncbi:MAG: Ig-like domain-containing protein [Bacteroides sp.]|nr:Ig-like domain-containing protein [Bacteroides sp.]
MKKISHQLLLAAGLLIFIYSCASIGRLEGGPIDEEPPVFIGSTPEQAGINSDRNKITIEFDEFIKLDKPGEKVVISPPQVQQPVIKANGRKVVVTLEDSLKPNTTYTIDFADAIQDNNEGNPLENFFFTFSTGEKLDTMAVGGTVLNASNLEPVKGMMVGLHADLDDSTFTTKPFERVGITNSRGQFSIRGVAPGKYRIFALQDADRNYFFNQPTEIVAFNDSLIIPSMEPRTRQDTTWLDTLTIDTIATVAYTHFLPDDILLRSFKEVHHRQRLAKTERLSPEKFSFYFTAPADSLPRMKGLNFDEKDAFIVENLTGRNDTLCYWIKDSLLIMQDTLQMELSYLYTDSLNQLSPRTDTINVVSKTSFAKLMEKKQEEEKKKREEEEKKNKRRKKDENDSIPPQPEEVKIEFLNPDVYAPNSLDVYDYLSITLQEPIAQFNPEGIHVKQKVDTLWEDIPFDLEHDTIDIKRYNIYADWKPENTYELTIDSASIYALYGKFNNTIRKEMKTKKLDEYGAIFYNVTGVQGPAFVELLDTKDMPVRQVPVVDGKADFYYLAPGKYGARLVVDSNENEVWDTGNYEKKRQPEMVYYYPQVLELKANFDLTQDWDVRALPLDRQKPLELKKQKPDEKKKKNNSSNSRYR